MSDRPVRVFSFSFSEPLFLGLIWNVAETGFVFLEASQDHTRVSDSVISIVLLQVADGVSCAVILYLALGRCFRLEVTHVPGYLSSWSSFCWADSEELDTSQEKTRKLLRLSYLSVPIFLLICFVPDYLHLLIFAGPITQESVCLYGSVRNVAFGFMKNSKLVLETLTVFA